MRSQQWRILRILPFLVMIWDQVQTQQQQQTSQHVSLPSHQSSGSPHPQGLQTAAQSAGQGQGQTLSQLAQAFQPRRDDSHVENVVKQARADEFSSEILTNRTRAYLSCESGEMLVKLNLSEPFRGVGYADYDRSSPCRFYGDGSRYYEMHIPLKGCGTKQEAPRLFINNIIVRFHRSLELEEDEIKTIICRYPPPFAPLPNNVVAPIIAPAPPLPAIIPPKLSEIELLLIICALLFLTLLLLGVGIAYFCFKKRNIKVVKKKKAFSSAPGSEITKLSGSTLGGPTLSLFDPIRIPRAQAALSLSGSEAALLTPSRSVSQQETIPSDYPSESPSSVGSDVDEIIVDGRRALVVSDIATHRHDRSRFENLAFIPDEASIHSGYPEDQERAESVSSVPIFTVAKPPTRIEMPKTRLAKEHTLTTIHEREDMLTAEQWNKRFAHPTIVPDVMIPPARSYITQSRLKRAPPPPSVSSYAPSLYGSIPDNDSRAMSEVIEVMAPTSRPPPPPTISSYAPSLYGSIPDNDNWSHSEMVAAPEVHAKVHQPKVQMATLTDYFVDTQRTTDIREDVTTHKRHEEIAPPAPLEIPEEIMEVTETTIVPHKPKITVQNIDDVYVTTMTEIDASEHITKHTRDTVENYQRLAPPALPAPSPPPPPTSFDVIIRHYPRAPDSPTPLPNSQTPPSPIPSPVPLQPYHETTVTTASENITNDFRYKTNWDSYSEVSEKYRDAESTFTEAHNVLSELPYRPGTPPPPAVSPTPLPARAPTPESDHNGPVVNRPRYSERHDIPAVPSTKTDTWDVLIRVLKPPKNTDKIEELTPEVQEKWRAVITTDTVFRSLIQECTTTEEYVRITRDERYYSLFTPTTWEVIIRVLSHPPKYNDRDPVGYVPNRFQGLPSMPIPSTRYRKKSEPGEPGVHHRQRKNSLPPVYETETSPESPTTPQPPSYPYTPGSVRSKRTSRSGSVWDYDMRSMTEEDVDFTRADRDSLWSVDTGYTYKTTRSAAERSTSEFVEDIPTVPHRTRSHPAAPGSTSSSSYPPPPRRRLPSNTRTDSELDDDEDDDDDDEHHHLGETPIYPVTNLSSGALYSTDSRAYAASSATSASAAVSQNYTSYSSSSLQQLERSEISGSHHRNSRQHRIQANTNSRSAGSGPGSGGPGSGPRSVGEREEIHSVTETDVYDWNR